MADPEGAQVIKEEDLPESNKESVTEIQSYLDTFNKEIEDPSQQSAGNVAAGTDYYMGSTQYYFQSSEEANADGQIMTVVHSVDSSGEPMDQVGDNYIEVTQVQEKKETIKAIDENQQVIDLNSGEYQTVTIVPSENSAGEVSYVLIVQQPGEESQEISAEQEEDIFEEEEEKPVIVERRPGTVNKQRTKSVDEEDLTVYEFDEVDPIGEEEASVIEDETEEKKPFVNKNIKKQTVAPHYMCNYCNYTTPKRYLLARHAKCHSSERPHKCTVCERGFKTVASLQNHINTHTGVKPHKCKFCESRFTTSGELVRHVRYKHTHEKPHKCSICDYASVELSKMRNHMRSHTGERPYQCPHCTYASPDTFKLKRHLRIHTGEKPYACDICQARFTQSNSLKSHRLIHTGDKPVFYCPECPATCGRKTDLRIHMQKLHTAEKPLKCKKCGKTCPDRYTYKIHCKSHEGEKCWKCELCPYASSSQRHLESHMLIHTDEKPFICDHCDQTFRQKQLLKRHVNLNHNPEYVPPAPKEKTHTCPECKKAFRHKGNLLRHMTLHDPESSLQQQQFALKIGRQKKVHIIDGHKVEVIPDEEEYEGEETEEESGGEMEVEEGEDGNQYVVLQMIQVNSADGTQQNMAVVPRSLMKMGVIQEGESIDTQVEENLRGETVEEVMPEEEGMEDQYAVEEEEIQTIKIEKTGMDDCFGFDEDDEEECEEYSKQMVST